MRQAPGLGCAQVRLARLPAALPSSRGLLTEKAAPVMNIIHSIFSLVLKFRSQLISQNWGLATGPRGAEHPNFPLMQQSYSTFKYYSHFLFKGEPSCWAGLLGWPGTGVGRSLRVGCLSSSDQAGEPWLSAPPGGLLASHQLQQLLPGLLRTDRRITVLHPQLTWLGLGPQQ